MTEPTVDELCSQLIADAHDQETPPGESPRWRWERWIKSDPELGWRVLVGLVDRAPFDEEVMYQAAWRVPQLIYQDFGVFSQRVLTLLPRSTYLDALLGPEVFIEADYAPRVYPPEFLAAVWLRNSRSLDLTRWPDELDREDPRLWLRLYLEYISRAPLRGLDVDDVDDLLPEALRRFGERVIEPIEAAARESAAVRLAIWSARNMNNRTQSVPPGLWSRFRAAAEDTHLCNTPRPAGELHRLAPLEEALIEAWFEKERSFWAWCALADLVDDEPEHAWQTTLEILRQSKAPAEWEHCGAGPLEDLIQRWPEEFIERVERCAESDPKFRASLGCVMISLADVPEPLASRYVKASGGAMRIYEHLEKSKRDSQDTEI